MDSRLVILAIGLLLCTVLAFSTSYLSESETTADAVNTSPMQWQLPSYLHEASGLAILDAEHLLVHDDEKGIIYRVTLQSGPEGGFAIDKFISIGVPPIDRDLEGIAINGEVLYLITSEGELLVVNGFEPTQLAQQLSATALDTGLKKICEIEGLHYDNGKLLAPCKMPLTDDHKDQLVVFAIDAATGEREIYLAIHRDQLIGSGKLRPTAITTHAGRDYIISTNRLIVIEKNKTNEPATLYKLPKKVHFQPEGIAVLADGSIYIVDDNRRGISRMTYYSSLDDLEKIKP